MFAIFSAMFATAQNGSAFAISGTVRNAADGDRIYISYDDERKLVDTITVRGGRFFVQGFLKGPTPASIYDNPMLESTLKGSDHVYLEPGQMKLTLDYRDFRTLLLDGSRTQLDHLELQKRQQRANIRLDSISQAIKAAPAVNLENARQQALDELAEVALGYLREHPKTFLAPYMLSSRLRRRDAVSRFDAIKVLYDNMDETVKSSEPGQKLRKQIEDFEKITIGKAAPHFALRTINGKLLDLAALKGKFVLLDFWASWCAPCRKDFPDLKKLYAEFHQKGLEVVNVSRDTNLDAWKKAIFKDEIANWHHISLKENAQDENWLKNNNLEKQYMISAIPVKVLIDDKGIIVGRWQGLSSQNIAELEKILSGSL